MRALSELSEEIAPNRSAYRPRRGRRTSRAPARPRISSKKSSRMIVRAGLYKGFGAASEIEDRATVKCRRKIEMSPGVQSRDDTPLAADATTQPLQRD